MFSPLQVSPLRPQHRQLSIADFRLPIENRDSRPLIGDRKLAIGNWQSEILFPR
jgi:hypothetical protein